RRATCRSPLDRAFGTSYRGPDNRGEAIMAGNQAVFDAALRRAQGYAFENQWDKAIKEYQRALAEFPNEVEARTNYAQALYRQGQLPGAFDEYTGLLKARPNDPFILGRLAEIAETLGRRSDALTYYQILAQVYLGQNQRRRQAEAAGTAFDEKTLRPTGQGPGGAAPREQQLDARELNEMLTLAMSYQERGQYAAALKQYEAVLNAGMRTPAVYYNLGLL